MLARIGSHVDPQLHNLPVYRSNYRTSKLFSVDYTMCYINYKD